MRFMIIGAVLTTFAASVGAQEFCAADAGNVPPCLAGTWTGSNDMADRLNQMFAGLPDDVMAAARPTSGQYLFMHVAANGRFVSSAMDAALDVNMVNPDSSVDWFETELGAAGVIGQLTAGRDGTISFCQDSPSPDQVTQRGEGPAGSFESPMTLPAAGATTVAMRFTCAGDSLQMFVDLPPPIGTVTYDLSRIAASDLPLDLDYLTFPD